MEIGRVRPFLLQRKRASAPKACVLGWSCFCPLTCDHAPLSRYTPNPALRTNATQPFGSHVLGPRQSFRGIMVYSSVKQCTYFHTFRRRTPAGDPSGNTRDDRALPLARRIATPTQNRARADAHTLAVFVGSPPTSSACSGCFRGWRPGTGVCCA